MLEYGTSDVSEAHRNESSVNHASGPSNRGLTYE